MRKSFLHTVHAVLIQSLIFSCASERKQEKFEKDLQAIQLASGEITLCRSGADDFGSVSFSQSCSESVKGDFDMAIALLHSFEYTEAEKMFARVIENDAECLMAYWGAAMCSFHPLGTTE